MENLILNAGSKSSNQGSDYIRGFDLIYSKHSLTFLPLHHRASSIHYKLRKGFKQLQTFYGQIVNLLPQKQ